MPPTSPNVPLEFQPPLLIARALSSTSNITCPKPLPNEHGAPLFGKGTINLHQFMIYVSAPCLLVTAISCFFLSWRHLHRYTAPQEQRQILRIVNLPVAYCLFNFLALTFTMNYLYIEPLAGIYEAFTVAALFLVILEWVCPDGTDREKFFDALPNKDKKGNTIPGGSLKWFQRTWQAVLLYPLLKTLLIVVQIVTQYFGDYCESSFSPKYAHLWLTLADYLFIGGAFGATITFARRVGKEVAPVHRLRAKIFSFLGILIFQLIQDLIFHLLNGKLFSPSKTATYNDINFGISSFMTCIESVIFSLIFQWSYSSGEYKEGAKMDRLGLAPTQRTKTWRAALNALNMSDIIAGTFVGVQIAFGRVQSRYGASIQQRRGQDQMHLEPLSERRGMRGYDQSEYEPQYASPPPFPPAARDPSPGARMGKQQTFRADEIRPVESYEGYVNRGYAHGRSEESEPLQPRPMV